MNKLEEVKQYRDNPAFNYSLLSQVIQGEIKEFKGSLASLKGSIVDTLLTAPEIFNDIYFISNVQRPTGALAVIVTEFFEKIYKDVPIKLEEIKTILLEEIEIRSYGNNWKNDTIWKKVIELESWWEFLNKKGQKEIITEIDHNYGLKLVNILKNNKPGNMVINSNCKFQVPLYGLIDIDKEQIEIKGLLDIVDERENCVIITDLKTTAFKDWDKVVEEKNYLIQVAMYYDLALLNYKKPVIFQWLVCQGYKVSLYKVAEIDIIRGREGREEYLNVNIIDGKTIMKKKYYTGYKGAIKTYLDCKRLNLDHFDITHYYNQGIMPKKSIYE